MDNFETLAAQKRLMERAAAEKIADRVVAALFVNGFGEHAHRLELRSAEERALGGWGKQATHQIVMLAVLGPQEDQ